MDDEQRVETQGVAEGVEGAAAPDVARALLKRRLIIGASVVAAFAVGFGGFMLLTGDKDPTAEVVQDTRVVVPDVRGMTLERATDDLKKAGLVLGDLETAVVEESVAPSGTVFTQEPLPGAKADRTSAVALVIAHGPESAVVAAAGDAQTSTGAESGTSPSGTGSTSGSSAGSNPPPASPPASTPPPAAETPASDPPPAPPIESVDPSQLRIQPSVIPKFNLLQPDWKTLVEHSDSALEWTSGPVTLTDGPKRIILNADGPTGNLVAVHSWGTGTSTDWQLRSLLVSQPGDLPYQSILDVPAGTYQFLVKSNSTSVLWTLKVQEKK